MALSVYPKAIPTFPTHRNLIDDVDANDINAIQREVTAIATSVGLAPSVYNDVSLPSITALATDTASLDDSNSIYNTSVAAQTNAIDYGSVSARLDAIQTGQQTHAFQLLGTGINLPASSNVDIGQRPHGIKMPTPDVRMDPYKMYNGMGVTLRKSGFWVIVGSILITRTSPSNNKNQGLFTGAIDRNETWIQGIDRQYQNDGTSVVALNSQIIGFFNRGDRITLRCSQSTSQAQTIRQARMAGFLAREG